MEGSRESLILSKLLRLITLLGVIGIAASPSTTLLYPMYPIYHTQEFEDGFVLNDEFPTREIHPFMADKIVIEELMTNGSAVVIQLYGGWFFDTWIATLRNVTRIQDIYLVDAPSESSGSGVIRISREDNQSVQVNVRMRLWGTYVSTDYLITSPSIFLLLAAPLIYSVVKNRGHKPTRSGYVALLLLVISGLLISPILVYTYNGGYSILRHDEVLAVQRYGLALNVSDSVRAFNVTVESIDSGMFSRIANISTNGIPVALTISSESAGKLGLTNLTALSSDQLQFEFPRDSLSEYTIQFSRIAQNTTVTLSVETVRDVWAPWIDPLPSYYSAATGLVIFAVALTGGRPRLPFRRRRQQPSVASIGPKEE